MDADEKVLPDLSARVAFTSEQTEGKANGPASSCRSPLASIGGQDRRLQDRRGPGEVSSDPGGRRRPGPGRGQRGASGRRKADCERRGGGAQGGRPGARGRRSEFAWRTSHSDRPRRKGLSPRRYRDPRLERHQPRGARGRVRGADGPLRLGEDDALEPHRRHRPAHARPHRDRRARHLDRSRRPSWLAGARARSGSSSSSTTCCRS